MTMTDDRIQDRIEAAKKAILEDINDGTVPTTVKSFSELHDYVDANEYLTPEDTDLPNIAEMGADILSAIGNEVSDAIDEWLKSRN